jgi:threonine dehydratase
MPSVQDLMQHAIEARERLSGRVSHTPLLALRIVGQHPGHSVMAKAENLQVTGSFKLRGAMNKSLLAKQDGRRGLVTASTGNHGIATAYVARLLGLECAVFLPSGISTDRTLSVAELGATIHETEGDALVAELAARDLASTQPDWEYVSPYNDLDVIAGQGSVGWELVSDIPAAEAPDAIYVAAGGGGLVAGIGVVIKSIWPRTEVVACLPSASAVLAHAVERGYVLTETTAPTLSEGTAGNIEHDTVTLPLCMELVDRYLLVEEPEIASAMRRCLLDEHLLIEGAAGVALGAYLADTALPPSARVVTVLCGGNVDVETIRSLL